MTTVAYLYTNPLLDTPPSPSLWGQAIDRLYHDQGDRHQWHQLLQDCQTQPVDTLLIRQLTDLGDTLLDIRDRLTQLQTLNIPFTTLHPIPDNLTDLQTLQAALQQRRIRQGHARNRLKTLPPPGRAPYGYRRSKDRYAIDRATAPIVKDFFDHFLLYGSLRGSVRHIEKKYGKKISASTGKRWLTSPVYRGDLVYQTGEVIPDTHPAILPRDEAAQVDRLLRRNRPLPPRTASAPRSLAGLVRCARCQSPMTITRVTARRKAQEYLYLRPTACPNRPKCQAIAYQQVLDQTIQRICADLPHAVADLQLPDMSRLKQGIQAQIQAQETILSQIPSLTTSGVLDAETAELRAYKVRAEIASLRSQLDRLPPVNLQATAQTVSLPQFWLDLSEAERRFYLREFLREVQIVRDGAEWQIQLVFIF